MWAGLCGLGWARRNLAIGITFYQPNTTGSPPWAFRNRDHLSNSLKELHSSS
jgi:hypothetical protein